CRSRTMGFAPMGQTRADPIPRHCGPSTAKNKRTKGPKSENLKSRRSARAYTEDLEQSIRREEGRIDRDRILQSWAFRRLEGVTQVGTPDQARHLMTYAEHTS